MTSRCTGISPADVRISLALRFTLVEVIDYGYSLEKDRRNWPIYFCDSLLPPALSSGCPEILGVRRYAVSR